MARVQLTGTSFDDDPYGVDSVLATVLLPTLLQVGRLSLCIRVEGLPTQTPNPIGLRFTFPDRTIDGWRFIMSDAEHYTARWTLIHSKWKYHFA